MILTKDGAYPTYKGMNVDDKIKGFLHNGRRLQINNASWAKQYVYQFRKGAPEKPKTPNSKPARLKMRIRYDPAFKKTLTSYDKNKGYFGDYTHYAIKAEPEGFSSMSVQDLEDWDSHNVAHFGLDKAQDQAWWALHAKGIHNFVKGQSVWAERNGKFVDADVVSKKDGSYSMHYSGDPEDQTFADTGHYVYGDKS